MELPQLPPDLPPSLAHMVGLIDGANLARLWGYDSTTNAFREQLARLRITPVPGRRGWYDPRLIRRRLDEAQGLTMVPISATGTERPMSALEQRKARNGKV
jgi:hypothetical protein